MTLGSEKRYLYTLKSWLASGPKQIIIVTVESRRASIVDLIQRIGDDRVQVFSIPRADYRRQMVLGIRNVSTEIVVFADDRILWGPNTFHGLLDALANLEVGGVNTLKEVVPTGANQQTLTFWESFGALNLARRNILHSFLAYFNEGQVLNLSGSTVAYRTKIIQTESFYNAFLNDLWSGKYVLLTGDDNFLTTWILHKGWKTAFVTAQLTTISCSVCPDSMYLRQVLRWSRDTARYYARDLGWACTTGGSKHVKRCLLNVICNYLSDIMVLLELCLLVSSAVLVGWIGGDGEMQRR